MLGRNDEALENFNRAVRAWKLASFMDPGSIMDGLFPVPNTAGSLSGTKSRQIVQGHATAQSGLGQAFHRLGQDEKAVVAYNRAIEINGLDPNAYIGRGDCRVSLGDHDQALADYNEAIRLGPDYSRAYSSRGKLLEAMGQDAQAEADYDRAIQLDPSFTYALRLARPCSPGAARTTGRLRISKRRPGSVPTTPEDSRTGAGSWFGSASTSERSTP